jgi:hypothetical protein
LDALGAEAFRATPHNEINRQDVSSTLTR